MQKSDRLNLKKMRIGFLLVCVFLLNFGSVLAQETQKTKIDTNREVVHTYVQFYLDQKDWAKAEQMINGYLQQDQADPLLWTWLGTAQIEQQKFAQACYAFQKSSTLQPTLTAQQRALYQLADCLQRGGKAREAEAILRRTDFAEEVIDLLHAGTIQPGQPLPPLPQELRSHWRLSGALGFGYDTNVLLVEEDLASQTPNNQKASPFVNPAFQAGYVGRLLGFDVDSRYLAAFTDYTSADAKSYNTLYQRADFVFGSGQNRYGFFAETLFMNRDPFQVYLWDTGVSWIHTLKQTDTESWVLEAPIRYQYYPLDTNLGADNNRAGGDLQLELNYRSSLGESGFFINQFILENQYTSGRNYRLTALTIPVTWGLALPFFEKFGLVNTFNASVDGQYYYQSDFGRRDLLAKGGAGLVKKIGDRSNASLDVSYLKNLSSVEDARYSKAIISMFLSHDFL
jgi:hypothetical protein